MQIIKKYKRKYLSWYSLSQFSKQKHEKNLNRKLNIFNHNFLKEISAIPAIRETIESFHLINLGAAHSSLPSFAKELIEFGAKATLLDASDNFFDSNKNIKILNKIIADKKANRNFYITKPPDSSSLLEPDMNKFSKYKFTAYLKFDKTVNDEVITFSDLSEDQIHKIPVNYLAMDIQGGELLALKGAPPDFFDELHLIVAETWFTKFYKDCPLFEDYLTYFKSKGYSLMDLSPIRDSHNINIYPYYDRARFSIGSQQLYSDMLLIKNQNNFTSDSLMKLFFGLLIDYRYSDIWDYHTQYGDILLPQINDQINSLFKQVSKIF